MTNIIKPKRTNISGKIPTTSDLTDGEMGVNTASGGMWVRDGNAIKRIADLSKGVTSFSGETGDINLYGYDSIGVKSEGNGNFLIVNNYDYCKKRVNNEDAPCLIYVCGFDYQLPKPMAEEFNFNTSNNKIIYPAKGYEWMDSFRAGFSLTTTVPQTLTSSSRYDIYTDFSLMGIPPPYFDEATDTAMGIRCSFMPTTGNRNNADREQGFFNMPLWQLTPMYTDQRSPFMAFRLTTTDDNNKWLYFTISAEWVWNGEWTDNEDNNIND